MNYADIKTVDTANGPGVRVSLFVSGCTHHCKNCFNSETWDFNYGKPFTESEEDYIIELLKPNYIAGFTLLGGDPVHPDNMKALLPLLRKIHNAYPDKNIWCFTGYTYEYLYNNMIKEHTKLEEFMSYIDILVDGPFIEEQKNLNLYFKGSENQRTIDVKKSSLNNIVTID